MSAKTITIISWVLSGLLAVAFIGSGMSKILGADMQLKNFDSWGYPQWLRYPIGLSEIAFAVGLLIPAYRTLTIYGIFIWAVVASVTHLQAGQVPAVVAPIAFAVLALVDLLVWRKAGTQVS